jgi:hypothetical protein
MTQDTRQTLERIIAYCGEKWAEADQAASGAVPPPEHLAGEKKAYNDVFQFARTLLADVSHP